jgi:FkbM family methyltransferase
MASVLKKLRKIPVFNKLISYPLRMAKMTNLQKRWPLSGTYRVTFNGVSFLNFSRCDDMVINNIFYSKKYESNELPMFLEYAAKATQILDIGANSGIYTILSAIANPGSNVHSFEPNGFNFVRLKKNVAINQLNNVTLNENAVGNANSSLQFTVPVDQNVISDTSSASAGFSQGTYDGKMKWQTVEVQQVTIDSYCALHKIPKVDLVKIDVEGFDEEVFQGATETILKDRPVIFCEIFFDAPKQERFRNFLQKINYSSEEITEGNYLLKPLNLKP